MTPTATTLAASASRINFGDPVEFTATVSSAGPAIDGGTVAFRSGSTVLGSAPVVNGTAVLSVPTLAVGSYRVTAAFSGTSDLLPSESGVNGTSPIRTIAGSRTPGFSGDGGAATSASLNYPSNLAVDAAGNVYVVDNGNNRIRKVAADGTITTVAGTGVGGFSGDGGPATSAQLNNPYSVAVDAGGTIFIGDDGNNRIRKVDAQGTITTYAGTGTSGFSGDGGPATLANLRVASMAIDAAGTVYFTDQGNGYVRKIAPDGIITTIAGSGTSGYSGDGGPGTSARIRSPYGVGVDAAGNVYFAEISNHVIRKVTPQGIISTYAGTGVAGSTGNGGQATLARLSTPGGMAVDASGNVFFNQFGTNQVRKVAPDGIISTVAGTGTAGYSGDGGPSTSAQLNDTEGLAIDTAGNLYLADSSNNVVRRVDGPVALVVAAVPTFTTGPTATITGTPTVGRTLFAGVGDPAPSPDSYSYVWYADGVEITDNTSSDPQALNLTPALAGKDITVEVTVHRDGYTDASDLSDPVGPVAKATFTTGPTATITGTPTVGRTVFAGVGEPAPSPDSYSYVWYADGVEITDNSSSDPQALNLTPALAGKDITVEVTVHRDGYTDASDLSDPVGPVAEATFTTGPDAVIDGEAVVGGTLIATPTDLDSTTPSADSYAYSWAADGQAIRGASGPTLTLSENEDGKTVTVTVTATRAGYTDATDTSAPTVPVASATFSTGPTATISGTAQVGQTLRAGTGAPVPDPEEYRFAWSADGTPLAGATTPTLRLTPDLRGRRITVTVTAARAGYVDATDTSAPTAAVVTDRAPSLRLTLSVPSSSQDAATTPDGQPTVRRGRTITLRWTSSNAQSLVAGGELADLLRARYGTRPIPAAGSVRVRLTHAGAHAYRLRAINETGTTTATTSIVAVRRPTRLSVETTATTRPGRTIRIRVTGLGYRERFYITVNDGHTTTRVRTGRANTTGNLTRRITIPRTIDTTAKTIRVRVTGRSTKRAGAALIRLR
ncbi:NHL domain-containing protein [Nocardioides lianchengensis]|uniref:NHL domain-containing protein n=1 Tax=Nocardioides lianchengensis TaxID=1045774 RepID=UPI0015C770CF|nr:Ig-like domain repeat protein [Nocardioides lianchengensis]NYG09388.1 hypothetical protein [Nocardioides lianchengensis]